MIVRQNKMEATFGTEYRTRQLLIAQHHGVKLWRHSTARRRKAVIAAYRAARRVVQRYILDMSEAFKSLTPVFVRAAEAMQGFSRALETKES